MELKTKPWFVINRGWERIIADENGVIVTDNKEAIDVISFLFKQEVKAEVLSPKKEEWKSKAKK